jgi:hypothetical protein
MMAVDREEQLTAALWWIDPVQGLIAAILAIALLWALFSLVQQPGEVQAQQVRADGYATVVAAQSTRIAVLEKTPTPTRSAPSFTLPPTPGG